MGGSDQKCRPESYVSAGKLADAWTQEERPYFYYTCGRMQTPPLRPLAVLRLVKDTSAWSNKKEALESEQAALRGVEAGLAELDEQGIAARIATAAAARDEAQTEFTRHAAAGPSDMLTEPCDGCSHADNPFLRTPTSLRGCHLFHVTECWVRGCHSFVTGVVQQKQPDNNPINSRRRDCLQGDDGGGVCAEGGRRR